MRVLCADVGSTYTKVAAVELGTGALLGTAQRRTTVDSDVLDGLDAALADVGPADVTTAFVCSSAGGGLRLAVVGYEQLVTAEAGQRVGLTAGARVVHVAAGRLDRAALAELRAARPDIVLLVGGTDGGDEDVLRHNADQLAAAFQHARLRIPVVLAGNAEARSAATHRLSAAGVPVVATDNVLPRIGQMNPGPARAAIRDAFLRHVIGGKRLSRGPRFASLVRCATPDAVLTGVELLADELGSGELGSDELCSDLLVVDVGGATTDVYSVVDIEVAAVAGPLRASRSVEGDLGLRYSAPGVVAAAVTERLLAPGEGDRLADAAALRAADPAYLPVTDNDHADEVRLAQLAAMIAVRRHARASGSDIPQVQPRRDLSRVGLLVGSGGVFRHAEAAAGPALRAVLADHAGGYPLPRAARVAIDVDYALAPAGLLAADHPTAARLLLRSQLLTQHQNTPIRHAADTNSPARNG
jgi:uncharacterized protein (TIGR01319 family)